MRGAGEREAVKKYKRKKTERLAERLGRARALVHAQHGPSRRRHARTLAGFLVAYTLGLMRDDGPRRLLRHIE